MGVAVGDMQMTVEEFCESTGIDIADVARMREIALDAVGGVLYEHFVDETFDLKTLNLVVFPGFHSSVANELLVMATRSAEFRSLRERVDQRVFVICRRQK